MRQYIRLAHVGAMVDNESDQKVNEEAAERALDNCYELAALWGKEEALMHAKDRSFVFHFLVCYFLGCDV